MKVSSLEGLRQTLVQQSPRYQGARSTWRAALIHLTALTLWALLLAQAWTQTHGMVMTTESVMAWSLGIVYVSYDSLLLAFVATQTWRLVRRPRQHDEVAATRPTIGVIVAAHNEAAALPVTLQALLGQTDLPDSIVIADDGSTDGTADLLRQHWGLHTPRQGRLSTSSNLYPNLYWLRLPHGGKARALNTALMELDTDVVLTVDGDTLLDKQAIAAVRRAFGNDMNLVAATGVITPVCGRDWLGQLFQAFQTYEYIRNFLSRYAWARFNSLLLVSGAFASFRREAVVSVGGFDENCLVEDYELIHRLHRHARNAGLPWRVDVLGEAHALTDAPSRIDSFLRQRRRWFGGFLQTQYWYRDMVASPRMGALGMAMLPVKALDTLQPLYGFTAFLILLAFIASGRFQLAGPIFAIMGTKVAIDLVYHLWSIQLYRRWTGDAWRGNLLHAVLVSILEPLSFQLLRHCGALLGWWSVLVGSAQWAHTAQRSVAEHRGRTDAKPPPALDDNSELRTG
jgi:cellulose synthase/poly-beta-1,6-N-acetylglucosamine synthase-like glycosyltransferase